MASIFTKIIEGSIPSETIAETESEISFLDINPCAEGHTLVVPKREVERFEDLDAEEAASLICFMVRIASAVTNCFGGIDYNVILNNGVLAGQEVMHVHFHIIPRSERSPRMFANRKSLSPEELRGIGDRIRNCL